MAKRTSKKGRDVPPLYVVVQAGKLAPAFQLDQERILSFRNDTRLVVTIETDGSRRGVRRWHAIIGKAVKNSLLPWVTASAADEAIRLALDLYEPKKAKDGSWHRVTQSLNDLTDEELDEQIEQMTALIYRISGVDPDDFQRELAGAGDERFASEYDKPAADNQNAGQAEPVVSPSGSATNSPDEVIPDAQSSGEGLADDDPPSSPKPVVGEVSNSDEATKPVMVPDAESDSAGDTTSQLDASAPESSGEEKATGAEGPPGQEAPAADLSEEDRQWLRDGARMMLAAQPEPSAEAKDVLFRQVKGIITLMPKAASTEARNRMEQVKQHCMGVCRGEWELDPLMVARAALTTVETITPAPVTMGRKAQ